MHRVVLRGGRHRGLLGEFAARGRRVWVRDVMELLAEAAMRENPVYRHAPKMRELARRLYETPQFARETVRLRRFLRGCTQLHIEGYVRFRMGWFAEMLDNLSYRLIKKLRAKVRED